MCSRKLYQSYSLLYVPASLQVLLTVALVDWLKEKIDNSSLFARDGDYDLASVGRWISIEVFALISPLFFCRASMLLFCMKTYSWATFLLANVVAKMKTIAN